MTVPMDHELLRKFEAFLAWEAAQKGGPAPKKPTVQELWDWWEPMASREISSWDVTCACHKKRILAFFGPVEWDQVTISKVQEFRSTMGELAPTTRNRVVKTLQSLYSWAHRYEKIAHNALRGIPWESEAGREREGYIDEEMFARFLRAGRPKLQLMLRLKFGTGCRFTEARELRKAEVVLTEQAIVLRSTRTKAKQQRVIPCADDAWEAVLAGMASSPPESPWVFPSDRDPMVPVHKNTAGRWFREARAKSGVTLLVADDEVLVPHHLRHSWATLNSMKGMPVSDIMNIAGWATERHRKRYTKFHGLALDVARGYMNTTTAEIRKQVAIGRELAEQRKSALSKAVFTIVKGGAEREQK